ncbi:hypothetical protein HanIR_Chr17g0856981 [Helianthus annuus]|nr:hypothetical protein HanIR_Chr17g0856981 [Helianthus annuus]
MSNLVQLPKNTCTVTNEFMYQFSIHIWRFSGSVLSVWYGMIRYSNLRTFLPSNTVPYRALLVPVLVPIFDDFQDRYFRYWYNTDLIHTSSVWMALAYSFE